MENAKGHVSLAKTVAEINNGAERLIAAVTNANGAGGGDDKGNPEKVSVPRVPLPDFDKKELAKLKRQWQMHVLLIQEHDDVPAPVAQFKAWLEGPAGLTTRMDGKVA